MSGSSFNIWKGIFNAPWRACGLLKICRLRGFADSGSVWVCRVICVVPASAQLTDSGALGIVHKCKRHQDTIIALTKCDQLLADGSMAVKAHFIDRLLGRHGECCQGKLTLTMHTGLHRLIATRLHHGAP